MHTEDSQAESKVEFTHAMRSQRRSSTSVSLNSADSGVLPTHNDNQTPGCILLIQGPQLGKKQQSRVKRQREVPFHVDSFNMSDILTVHVVWWCEWNVPTASGILIKLPTQSSAGKALLEEVCHQGQILNPALLGMFRDNLCLLVLVFPVSSMDM